MAWQNEKFSDKLKEKIRDFVWSNLSSRRFMAQTADLYTGKILSVIIAMLGGKEQEENDKEEENLEHPAITTENKASKVVEHPLKK